MKVKQTTLKASAASGTIADALKSLQDIAPHWVLVFGGVELFTRPEAVAAVLSAFPESVIMGCSTAGEIAGNEVRDNACVLTAVHLDSATLRRGYTEITGMDDSRSAGERIGQQLSQAGAGLKAVMVLGPGVQINGTALVEGIESQLGSGIPITGGLAGDGGAFRQTWTLSNAGSKDNGIVAIGFCGEELNFAHGSFGGWEVFGPARKVTRCEGNVLFELDGEPALEVYKRYLGDHAKGLPASGLLFPFAMLGEDHSAIGLIRTILAIDEAAGSLTLAGAINDGGYLKLMHASTDRLVNGAESAAEGARKMFTADGDSLAVLVSCVGRKLVMGDRIDEEVEAVADVVGSKATLTGFYSYGEISPFTPGVSCQLHNQTMTITWLGER
ncbi:MAG: FIST C-terminal domain-containing protein [Rhodocyclaceae bacterium]|nr:FIST C-terminal domain-containing protein [Rhodocyclaceae bacterium]